jgi:hypothetical protein
MLSQIDNILFPDRCEVLEVAPQRFVFPIYKNGSRSLHNSGFRTLTLEEIKQLETVEVFVRDPIQRFESGVQKFMYLMTQEGCDLETTAYFIHKYLFLNSHYAPQLFWLLNLQRFTTAKIKLNHISNLNEVTKLHHNKGWHRNTTSDMTGLTPSCPAGEDPLIHSDDPKIQFYYKLDQVLVGELLGRTVTFKQIVQTIRHRFPDTYKEVIQRSIDLCNVLD